MNRNAIGLFAACLLAGCAAFVGTHFVVAVDPPTPVVQIANGSGPDVGRATEPEVPIGGVAEIAIAEAKPTPARDEGVLQDQPASAKPALIRRWSAPCDAKWKADALLNPARIVDLAFDVNGTRIVSLSKRDIHSWNLGDGRPIRSFTAADHQKPIVSRDARFIAMPTQTDVAILDPMSGNVLGKHVLPKDRILSTHWEAGAFSASGEYLLIGTAKVGSTALWAIASRTGRAKRIPWPEIEKDSRFHYHQIAPLPGSATLLIDGHTSKTDSAASVFSWNAIDRSTKTVSGLGIVPWRLVPNRGIRIANDGTKLLAYDHKAVVACDLVRNAHSFTTVEDLTSFSHPVFTPDCKRCLYVRHPNFRIYRHGLAGAFEYPPDSLELVDAATGRKLASFEPVQLGFERGITALEISHDGKTIAVAAGTELAIFDFATAFGKPVLPPITLPTEAEQYPTVD